MFLRTLLAFRRCKTMISPIGLLWSILSVMVAGTCCFSFIQPFWFVHPDFMHSFGMYNFCIRDLRFRTPVQRCTVYGGAFNFGNIPTEAWQATCVVFGGGCMFLCLGAVLSTISLCMTGPWDQRLSIGTGYIQTVGVMLLFSGLIIYPLGLGSGFVQHYCGDSAIYRSGHCQMGWSYMLAIMGTALSIFCPFLSQFTDFNVYEDDRTRLV